MALRRISGKTWIVVAGVVLTVLFLGLPMTVCTDRAYVCEYTGSKKGHRDWIFGIRTAVWSQTSGLEQFIRDKFPDSLKHEWTSYAGTGRNMFGRRLSYGHGSPGPIFPLATRDILMHWCRTHSDVEKKALYDLLRTDNRAAKEAKVSAILEELVMQK